MANFGARLSYPLPERIAAEKQRRRVAQASGTVVHSPLQRTLVRAISVLFGLEPLRGGRR
jgi:hypothetical protein